MTRVPRLGPRGEGWVVLQFACLALVVATASLAPPITASNLTAVAQPAGYVVGIIGAVLFGAGIADLRRARALTALPYPRDEASLVQVGPYRYLRHPIYSGLVLGSLGLALLAPWLGTFAAVAVLGIVLDLKRRREEAWLVERFPGYEAYRARTKALVPFVY